MWHESIAAMQTYKAVYHPSNPASWPRDTVAVCAVMAQPGQHFNLSHRTPHRSCSRKTSVTELWSLIWTTSSTIFDIVVFQICSDASCTVSLTRINTSTGSTSTSRTSKRAQEATPRSNMEEIASPPAHSCAHCVDIVFPGSPEEIHWSFMGAREDPLSNLRFHKVTMNRLGISLADLGLKANAKCDFAQYLKDYWEHRIHEKFRHTNPDAIHLYTHRNGEIDIHPLICLQGLHLPDNVCGDMDVSRCFVNAASYGDPYHIRCVLIKTSGKSLLY